MFLTNDQKIGYASYGKNTKLCSFAKEIGEHCFEAMKNFGADEKGGE